RRQVDDTIRSKLAADEQPVHESPEDGIDRARARILARPDLLGRRRRHLHESTDPIEEVLRILAKQLEWEEQDLSWREQPLIIANYPIIGPEFRTEHWDSQ